MRACKVLASAIFAAMVQAAAPAAAADGFEIVVPGRPGVPIIWFGQDISGAVIEGDRGLDRPGNPITIIPGGPRALWWAPPDGGYFPTTGHRPSYGRDEHEPAPNHPLPPRAESYFRSWGAQSMPEPATLPPDAPQPPIVVVPQVNTPPVPPYRRAPNPGPH